MTMPLEFSERDGRLATGLASLNGNGSNSPRRSDWHLPNGVAEMSENLDLVGRSILARVSEVFGDMECQGVAERIRTINAIKLELSKHSPLAGEPVDCVLWVPVASVVANDYNPNAVAPPEMRLLEHSVSEDGYTQPIVTWRNGDLFEVVDGYHRNRVGRECATIRDRIHWHLPITVVNASRLDRGDRIAATIRHNRARGKHRVDSMSDIVVELKRRNWSDDKIGRELGMDADEVLRLTQITGLAEMFADREFSQAWEAEESTEINEDDNLTVSEENSGENPSSLSDVGGLESGNVSGDSGASSTGCHRRGGKAPKTARTPKAGHAASAEKLAKSRRAQSDKRKQKPGGVVGAGGMLPESERAGLPYETGVAQPKRKPTGRRKRGGRGRD